MMIAFMKKIAIVTALVGFVALLIAIITSIRGWPMLLRLGDNPQGSITIDFSIGDIIAALLGGGGIAAAGFAYFDKHHGRGPTGPFNSDDDSE